MKTQNETIEKFTSQDYQYGFVTDIEQDTIPPGIDENVVRFISNKKNEPDWLLNWRLKAFEHWKNMEEPQWAKVDYPKIDYQSISYYSAPKDKSDGPKSLDEVDPELIKTYNKLGIPLEEQKIAIWGCC